MTDGRFGEIGSDLSFSGGEALRRNPENTGFEAYGFSTKNMLVMNALPTLTTGCGDREQIEMSSNKNVYDYLPFDSDTQEYAYANVVMPEDWDEDTIVAKFFWTHPEATAYDIIWGLQGVAVGNSDTLDVAQGTVVYVTDSGSTTYDLFISPATSAVTISGSPLGGELVQFRITRKAADASDTLDVDGYLIGVLITYGVT